MAPRLASLARGTLLLAVVALLSCAPAYAQTGTGEIWGRVAADTGDVLANADVTLTNVDTLVDRKTHSDDRGRFAFAAVPPGRYQVTAQHDGFAGRRQDDITLVPAQRLQIELPLRRAPLPETIALNPYPPIAESGRTHASAVVAETEIRDLPVMGRRYLRLAQLAPAVSEEAATGGLSVMNLPGFENRLVIDGFNHTSSITGEPIGGDGPEHVPYQLSQESMEAFRIETNGAPAEVGGAAAGTFNVVTRSGSNNLRGSAYEFFGDRALTAERTLDERNGVAKPPYRNNQFGAVAGGPLSKEHNFAFLSYDGSRRMTGPGADQDQNLLLARTDHHYAGQHLMLRYMDQRYDGAGVDVATEPSLLRTRSGAASVASVLTGTILNEARAQYARIRDDATEAIGSVMNAYGPHRFVTDRVQFDDSLSWVAGGHSFKAGGDMLLDRNRGVLFSSIPTRADVKQYGAFVQDAWRATRALTVDLGVRYDLQDFGSAVLDVGLGNEKMVPRDPNNWAPRVGLSFAPGERKQVFRAAYGLFYGSTPAFIPAVRAYSPVRIRVDPSFKTARVHQASAGWEIEKYRAGSLGIDYLFARGERLPRAVDVNVSVPRGLNVPVVSFQSTGQSLYNGITLHARARVLQQLFYTAVYTVARTDETPQQPLGMLFVCPACARRSLAIDGSTLQARSPGNNDQHQRLVLSAMYDTSLLAVDRHGLSKRLIADWEFAAVYAWHTGNPYTAYIDSDLNRDFNSFNDVAPGTTWNQYRLPYYGSLDPRVARRIRLGGTRQLALIWETFNLTNRANYTAVVDRAFAFVQSSPVPNPQFGQPTQQLNGRLMQLAARITF